MDAKLFSGIYKSKAVIIIAGLAILYTLIGFFLLPYLVERYLPSMLGRRLGCEVSLKEVKINPYAMTLEAKEFQIKEPSGRAMTGFQRLYVDFELSSLFRWALTFAEVDVDSPAVNLVIDPDGKVNLARLAGQETAAATTGKKESKPLRLLLRNITVNQGRIDVTDNRQSIPANVSFYPLNIKLADISTLPDRKGPYTLTATSADGATLKWSGQISLQPLRSEGNLGFEQISLSTPWKFFRSSLNISSPRGNLGLTTHYLFDYSKEKPVITLDALNVSIKDVGLQLEGAGKDFLDLQEITLDNGKIDLMQQKVDADGFAIRGGSVDLIKDKTGDLNVQKVARRAAATVSTPSTSPANVQTPWTVNVSGISLEDLAVNYTDQGSSPAVALSAKDISLNLKAAITTGSPDMQAQINDLGLSLRQIAIGYAGASRPPLQAGSLTVAGGALDLGKRSVSIATLEVKGGRVDVIRNKDNTINLAKLFGAMSSAPKGSEKEPQAATGDPWQYVVENISLSGFKTQVSDLTVKPDTPLINLDNISVSASHFDGKSPFPFKTGLHVIQGGDISASGTFDPTGIAVKTTVNIKDLALPIAQPYLSQVASGLTLNSGRFSAGGAFDRTVKGGMAYKGHVRIAGLKIIENSTRDTLIGWEELKTPEARFGMDPGGLEMDTLKLTGLECKFIISEDKTVNVVEAFKTNSRPSTEPQTKEPAPVSAAQNAGGTFPVRVNRLSMEKGKVDFADLSLTPQFGAKIHELNGVVIGISSTPGARTQVELEGRVDEYGTNNVKGEINVFDPRQFTDISVVFKNVEMSALTPYSGKFAGYKIDSGRLSLDLQYKIQNSKLLGQNKIIIDSLKLGQKVESPDAVHLPLKLAVAILKDANGVIDIDLPVSGDLNDPEFRYGPLIWKAIVNLLTRLVTSPFRALGALFGGGEDLLNAVNFDAGKGDVPPPEQEKLVKLLNALRQRPQLKLVVTARYNSDSDGQAIRQLQVRRAVAEANGMELEPGEDPGPVDFSNPRSQEKLAAIFIERYGREAYDVLNPPVKVDDEKAKVKETKKKAKKKQEVVTVTQEPIDPGELAKRLFADLIKREQVEPSALKQLADNRAQAIVTLMAGPDGLPAERVMVKPSEGTTDKQIPAAFDMDAMD